MSQCQGTVIEPSFAQPASGYILEGNTCVCGSFSHETPRYRLCPLNRLNTFNENDPKLCKCGSNSHLRTNHKSCRLNKNNVQNSLANQIINLDDVNELLESDVNIFRSQLSIRQVNNSTLGYQRLF